jgi:predicted acyl esterase
VPFDARGSAKQVYATGLNPNAKAKLLRNGRKLRTRRANDLGGVLFRRLKPGGGYRVRSGGATSPKLTVLSNRSTPPDDSVYDQEIVDDGYGYMTMRDGTKLAYFTRPVENVSTVLGLPLPPLLPGPRPTLIEYAGYGYADPDGPESGIALIGNLMGFNVVNVNMRGTGCSGGAFDFFEPLQSLDGYDIVETVARQPWVKNGKPGLMGISYGGISQLFVGATRPPSLAAITPLSLLDQVATTLFPGGILNTGFALEWAKDRIREARPATANEDEGQRWAYERIQNGDTTCADNQAMHGEAVNLLKKIERNSTYRPKVADPLSPATFVDKINVPTFLGCQWQDEQTGGHCANMADRFTGTDKKWLNFTNGTHVDSLNPENFNRFFDFLNIYVAEQPPAANPFLPVIKLGAPLLYEEAFGISGVTLPPDPIQSEPTLAGAQAAFEALDPVRILFENGSGGSEPGQPYPGFEQSFDKFPVPGTQARSWFVGGNGSLGDTRPQGRKRKSFKADPRSTQPTNFTGDTGSGGLWTALPDYQWEPHPDGTAASFITDPLEQDTAVIGAGKVEFRLKSARRDVDLQATISEVRPDDKEVFVQGGWVRASMRKLDRRKSSNLEPVLSLRKRHVKAMPRGRFTKVTIPLYYQGHAYRAGSRIRVTISGVHGDQPIWAFDEAKPTKGKTRITISSSRRKPSRLVLPVVPGVDVPDELPPCPGLRAQPCREFGAD